MNILSPKPLLTGICFLGFLAPQVARAQVTALSNETRVNTTTAGDQYAYFWSVRTAAVQPDGSIIQLFIDAGGLDGSAQGVFGQRFDASGAPLGSQFQVNTITSGDQGNATIAVAPDGSFIVGWDGPGSGTDAFAQRFDQNGVRVGDEFLLNTSVNGTQKYPEIDFFPDGTFVAAFVDGAQTVLQRFDAQARTIGQETRISSVAGDVIMDSLNVRPDNSVLLTWTAGGEYYGESSKAGSAPGLGEWRARARGLTGLLAAILGASLPAQAQAENGAAAAPPRPAPVIQCDEPVASFGEQAQDAIVQHVFAIWNRGDAPLEISGVKACCGATAVLADQVVAPGEKTSVALVASLRGRSGTVQRSIRIASNDPKRPEYLLQLVGSVPFKTQAQPAPPAAASHGGAPPVASVQKSYRARPNSPAPPITPNTPASPGHISVVPAELHLVPTEDASPLTQTLLIRSANNTSFQVTRVDSPSADWTVDLRPVAPGLWRVRIQHIVNGAAFDGKSIRIHTDVPDFPVLSIPVRWNNGATSASQESDKTKDGRSAVKQ